MIVSSDRVLSNRPFNDAPIGIFDSGFGGLTVAREIAKELPEESIVYFGDTARCPYGPRSQDEVDGFVQQICTWLVGRDVKLLVIACNTATAAGLEHAQQRFSIPVIGAVIPGARAAARATKNRRVGVIATKGTVESGCYPQAIRNIDAGITVFSTATPKFVDIVEQGIRMSRGPIEDLTSLASKVYIRPAFQEIARDYLEPLRRCEIDTLVLGCTHYPMLKALIGGVIGHNVLLVSSAEEMAKEVRETLSLPMRAISQNTSSSPRRRIWMNSSRSGRGCSANPSSARPISIFLAYNLKADIASAFSVCMRACPLDRRKPCLLTGQTIATIARCAT